MGRFEDVRCTQNSGGVKNIYLDDSAISVKTGSGNDEIDYSDNVGQTTVVDLGAGNDKFNVNGDVLKDAKINLGAGDDVIDISGVVNTGAVIDGGEGSDTLELKLVGAANIEAFKNFEMFDVAGMTSPLDLDILADYNTVTEIVGSDDLTSATELTKLLGAGVNFRATGDMGSNVLSLTQTTAVL